MYRLNIFSGIATFMVAMSLAGQSSRPPLQDPALTTGVLPNGMHYYIRPNTMPAKRAQLWLVVDAGSLQEDDDQQGYAHFMEHMAFNGTKRFPKHGMIDFLESVGMNFGADLNAFTGFDETVYQLTIPTDDRKAIVNGLKILEDMARGDILIDSSEVIAERGVIMGEWRSRLADTNAMKAMIHGWTSRLGANAPHPNRMPIGQPRFLMTAEPAPIRRFYKDWYRPDLMAVVVVGDIDRKTIEAAIRAQFGSIPTVRNPRPKNTWKLDPSIIPPIDMYTELGDPLVNIQWRLPEADRDPESFYRQMFIEQFMFEYLQKRYGDMRRQDRRPFFGVGGGREALERGAGSVYTFKVAATPDSLVSGLRAALMEVHRIATYGIDATKLEEMKRVMLHRLQGAADAASAQASSALAEEYMNHYLTKSGHLLSPQQTLEIARRVFPSITPGVTAEAAKFWRQTANRNIYVTVPSYWPAKPPTEQEILAVFGEVEQAAVEANPRQLLTGDAQLVAHLPSAGRIVKEEQHPEVGITTWTLSNGARVFYKPTDFNPDGVGIYAHSYGGYSRLPDSLFYSPGRLVGKIMTDIGVSGGTEDDSLNHQVTDKTGFTRFRVQINFIDEFMSVGGSPKELETIFQVLYKQFTMPSIDSTALEVWRKTGKEGLKKWTDENDKAQQQDMNTNPRLVPLSPSSVDVVTVDQAMAVYRDRFSDASDFTFIIVGAGSPADIKRYVEQYIATLPSLNRTTREQPLGRDMAVYQGISRGTVENPQLHAKRAVGVVEFAGLFPQDSTDYFRERQRLSAVSLVLKRRLREKLREELSATYGVEAGEQIYFNPKMNYRIGIMFDADPPRMNELMQATAHELDSIRSYEISDSELESVNMILRRGLEVALNNNGYWFEMIKRYEFLGLPIDRIANPYEHSLTAREIREAALRYIPKDRYTEQVALPTERTIKEAAERDN